MRNPRRDGSNKHEAQGYYHENSLFAHRFLLYAVLDYLIVSSSDPSHPTPVGKTKGIV
jgi:hypothetical protein